MTLVIYNGSYFSPRRSLLCPKHAKNDSFCTKKKKKKNNNNNTIRIFMEKNYSIKTCQWNALLPSHFFVASPQKPYLHLQENRPSKFTQIAFLTQLWDPSLHSSISTHCFPSPEKPLAQTHLYDPSVLRHSTPFALRSQGCCFFEHSSTSSQVRPSPSKPLLQWHS